MLENPKALRDRDGDRKIFTDAAFNRWLDESISDSGHTVWDTLLSTADAWAGWNSRLNYERAIADDFSGDDEHLLKCIHALLMLAKRDALFPEVPDHATRLLTAASVRLRTSLDKLRAVEVVAGEAAAPVFASADSIRQIRRMEKRLRVIHSTATDAIATRSRDVDDWVDDMERVLRESSGAVPAKTGFPLVPHG